MSNDIDKSNTTETTSQIPTEGIDNSRRLITKTGLIMAPVILTVTSRPVLGGTWSSGGSYDSGGSYGGKTGGGTSGGSKGKCTLSGFMSGNLSRPGDSNCVCKEEYSKKHWKCHEDKWSNSDCSPGKIQWIKNKCDNETDSKKAKVCWGGKDSSGREATKCSDKFGSYGKYSNEKMMDVLWKADLDENKYDIDCQLTAHAIAAYCNSSTYSEYGLSCNDVVDKFQKACNGTYKNYFTEHDGLDCKEALKKEFEFLNCEDSAPDYSYNCNDSIHWDGGNTSTSCYHHYQEYKKCKYTDNWSYWSGKECKDLKEYKDWKYSNTSYSSGSYSSDYTKYCSTYKTGDGWSGGSSWTSQQLVAPF